jgi:hypothetical protein
VKGGLCNERKLAKIIPVKSYCNFDTHSDKQDFIINIPISTKKCKIGKMLPNKLGEYSFMTTKSFEFIIKKIEKIHNQLKPLLWLCPNSSEIGSFTVSSFHMSYKIYIYVDVESDAYIVEIININMYDNILTDVFKQLVSEL